MIIGRAAKRDVTIADVSVAKLHIEVTVEEELLDLGERPAVDHGGDRLFSGA